MSAHGQSWFEGGRRPFALVAALAFVGGALFGPSLATAAQTVGFGRIGDVFVTNTADDPEGNLVLAWPGPGGIGSPHYSLALTRPITFDEFRCVGAPSGGCIFSSVGKSRSLWAYRRSKARPRARTMSDP